MNLSGLEVYYKVTEMQLKSNISSKCTHSKMEGYMYIFSSTRDRVICVLGTLNRPYFCHVVYHFCYKIRYYFSCD